MAGEHPTKETVDQEVTALTVGDLRRALKGVPDDTPLRVDYPNDPYTSHTHVVIDAQLGVFTSGRWPKHSVHAGFWIDCDDDPLDDERAHHVTLGDIAEHGLPDRATGIELDSGLTLQCAEHALEAIDDTLARRSPAAEVTILWPDCRPPWSDCAGCKANSTTT